MGAPTPLSNARDDQGRSLAGDQGGAEVVKYRYTNRNISAEALTEFTKKVRYPEAVERRMAEELGLTTC
jgi:hypothetical protein